MIRRILEGIKILITDPTQLLEEVLGKEDHQLGIISTSIQITTSSVFDVEDHLQGRIASNHNHNHTQNANISSTTIVERLSTWQDNVGLFLDLLKMLGMWQGTMMEDREWLPKSLL